LGDASVEECSQLVADWHAIADNHTSCDTDRDCIVAGGPREISCSCVPSISACGQGVNGDDYNASASRALEERFYALGCSQPGICDCARNGVSCVNHACRTILRSCLMQPDASLPDTQGDASPDAQIRDATLD